MNIEFNYNGNSFIAGAIACAAVMGLINIYWLIAVPFILTSFDIKGMPYAKLTYNTGKGWKLVKGRYT